MKDCVFCNKERLLEDIVYNSNNFFVKVGFGIVGAGHVMIVTNKHYSCFGDLPDHLEEEYEELRQKLQKKISDKISEPFLIEYGILGQSVHHAHIHFIPSKGIGYKVNNVLEEMVIPEGIEFEEADRKRLKEIFSAEGVYVSIEEHGKMYVCHVNRIPYIEEMPILLDYRTFFTKNGLRGVSGWKKMSNEEIAIDEEKRRLTKKLILL